MMFLLLLLKPLQLKTVGDSVIIYVTIETKLKYVSKEVCVLIVRRVGIGYSHTIY